MAPEPRSHSPIRDTRLTLDQWDQSIGSTEDWFQQMQAGIGSPSRNPDYFPQYVFTVATARAEQLLRRYSRGDDVYGLASELPPLLDAWERAEALGRSVWLPEVQQSRHRWDQNFDQYQFCFWLVGLALALEVDESIWKRLLALMAASGGDRLLDRIIARREPAWPIGERLCYPWIYGPLLEAIDEAPAPEHAERLGRFVERWYAQLGLDDRGRRLGPGRQPYWYSFGSIADAWFGAWCVEAVAAVKAFGLDDGRCQGHPNYPGELLRPERPGKASDPWPAMAAALEPAPSAEPASRRGGIAGRIGRLFGR